MIGYYEMAQLMTDVDTAIISKEKELEMLKLTNINNDIMINVKIKQLEYEINELNIQRTYYNNKITDELMKNSTNQPCANGCCKYCNNWF